MAQRKSSVSLLGFLLAVPVGFLGLFLLAVLCIAMSAFLKGAQ